MDISSQTLRKEHAFLVNNVLSCLVQLLQFLPTWPTWSQFPGACSSFRTQCLEEGQQENRCVHQAYHTHRKIISKRSAYFTMRCAHQKHVAHTHTHSHSHTHTQEEGQQAISKPSPWDVFTNNMSCWPCADAENEFHACVQRHALCYINRSMRTSLQHAGAHIPAFALCILALSHHRRTSVIRSSSNVCLMY